jgi:hypothetical protein
MTEMMGEIGQALAKLFRSAANEEIYVTGSGLVNVPLGRINEVSKVVAEFHSREAEKAKALAGLRIS